MKNDVAVDTDLTLLILRTLRNDSVSMKDPKYQIVSEADKSIRLDTKTGEITYDLRSISNKGSQNFEFFSKFLLNYCMNFLF